MMSIVPDRLKEEVRIITREETNNLNRLREIKGTKGKGSWDISIQILKEELRKEGRGQISYTELKNAISANNTQSLINLLQERFLDFVSEVDIDVMYTYVTSKDKLRELYALADNNNRFIFSVMSL